MFPTLGIVCRIEETPSIVLAKLSVVLAAPIISLVVSPDPVEGGGGGLG